MAAEPFPAGRRSQSDRPRIVPPNELRSWGGGARGEAPRKSGTAAFPHIVNLQLAYNRSIKLRASRNFFRGNLETSRSRMSGGDHCRRSRIAGFQRQVGAVAIRDGCRTLPGTGRGDRRRRGRESGFPTRFACGVAKRGAKLRIKKALPLRASVPPDPFGDLRWRAGVLNDLSGKPTCVCADL